jgi:hypothetical protein
MKLLIDHVQSRPGGGIVFVTDLCATKGYAVEPIDLAQTLALFGNSATITGVEPFRQCMGLAELILYLRAAKVTNITVETGYTWFDLACMDHPDRSLRCLILENIETLVISKAVPERIDVRASVRRGQPVMDTIQLTQQRIAAWRFPNEMQGG